MTVNDPSKVLIVTEDVTEDTEYTTFLRFVKGQVVTQAIVDQAAARGLDVPTQEAKNEARFYPGAVINLAGDPVDVGTDELDYQGKADREASMKALEESLKVAEEADKFDEIRAAQYDRRNADVELTETTVPESTDRPATNAENVATNIAKAKANDPTKSHSERVADAQKLEAGAAGADPLYGATHVATAPDEEPKASDPEKPASLKDEAEVYKRLATPEREMDSEADQRRPRKKAAAPRKKAAERAAEANKNQEEKK